MILKTVSITLSNFIFSVELQSGTAEIFGTEMVINMKYNFKQGAKIAVFTFHGCQILVLGKLTIEPYTSEETPIGKSIMAPWWFLEVCGVFSPC